MLQRTTNERTGKRSHTVIAHEREGRLWIQIPRAIIRHLGLKPGDKGRWRKVRGENAVMLTFNR